MAAFNTAKKKQKYIDQGITKQTKEPTKKKNVSSELVVCKRSRKSKRYFVLGKWIIKSGLLSFTCFDHHFSLSIACCLHWRTLIQWSSPVTLWWLRKTNVASSVYVQKGVEWRIILMVKEMTWISSSQNLIVQIDTLS